MNAIKNAIVRTLHDLIILVKTDEGLSSQRKMNLVSSIRKFAEAAGGTLTMSASFPVFRSIINQMDISGLALSPSRWSNIRSDLTFVLRRYGASTRAPLRKHLSPAWSTLRDLLDGIERLRRGLSSFIHWCNSMGYSPSDVCDEIFAEFFEHLKNGTLKKKPKHTYQNACKLWNDAVGLFPGWPQITVTVPSYKKMISFPWDAFPISFVRDIDAYDRFMGTEDLTSEHCVNVPRKASTLEHHRKQIRRWASALIRDGFPIEELIDLSVLVRPDNFLRAMRYYVEDWSNDDTGGDASSTDQLKPSHFEMAATMVVVAKEYVCLDKNELEVITKLRDRLKCRKKGFTIKNKDRIRPFNSPQNVIRFFGLTEKLINLAMKTGLSHRAALSIQKALVHEILINAPIRFGNLVGLNIHRHLKRIEARHHQRVIITIPEFEVKNGEYLEYELPAHVVRLLDTYIGTYRPILLMGEDAGWLFPGAIDGEHKNEVSLRENLVKAVKKHTGLTVNPHLYRHLAAFFYLQENPGEYETVKRLLAHKSVDTTMTFYAEFEALAARKLYTDHLFDRKVDLEARIK
ncbi:MAG: tyrosine-type recombinase/integrase [Rhodospirillaceae bacterium]|jgi:integrase|nr:tyrosine-type recombinase/integrase [Rhodospirillaceae bacterium]MBT5839332.1 tyrosine-type recombinase/integrase [Rhodospirillaceae bacterium]MBT6861148.1 tyrosine-type recombinase/integrase [Rhodospirillaceae bacterium]